MSERIKFMKKLLSLLTLVYMLTTATSAQTNIPYMGYLSPSCDTCKIVKDTTNVTDDFNYYNILSYGNTIQTNFGFGFNFNKLVVGMQFGFKRYLDNTLDVIPSFTLGRLISNDLIVGTELTYWNQSNTKFGYGFNLTYKVINSIGISYGQNTLTGTRIGLMITDIF